MAGPRLFLAVEDERGAELVGEGDLKTREFLAGHGLDGSFFKACANFDFVLGAGIDGAEAGLNRGEGAFFAAQNDNDTGLQVRTVQLPDDPGARRAIMVGEGIKIALEIGADFVEFVNRMEQDFVSRKVGGKNPAGAVGAADGVGMAGAVLRAIIGERQAAMN